MNSARKGFNWRFGYGVFCLVFAAWVIYLGLDNFDKVHGEYRRARKNMLPAETEKIVLQELVDQCRREAKRNVRSRVAGDTAASGVSENACLAFPETVLEERKKVIAAHLLAEKKRFQRKLVLFYTSFGIFFVVLPLASLYLLLSFSIWIFRNLKFVN